MSQFFSQPTPSQRKSVGEFELSQPQLVSDSLASRLGERLKLNESFQHGSALDYMNGSHAHVVNRSTNRSFINESHMYTKPAIKQQYLIETPSQSTSSQYSSCSPKIGRVRLSIPAYQSFESSQPFPPNRQPNDFEQIDHMKHQLIHETAKQVINATFTEADVKKDGMIELLERINTQIAEHGTKLGELDTKLKASSEVPEIQAVKENVQSLLDSIVTIGRELKEFYKTMKNVQSKIDQEFSSFRKKFDGSMSALSDHFDDVMAQKFALMNQTLQESQDSILNQMSIKVQSVFKLVETSLNKTLDAKLDATTLKMNLLCDDLKELVIHNSKPVAEPKEDASLEKIIVDEDEKRSEDRSSSMPTSTVEVKENRAPERPAEVTEMDEGEKAVQPQSNSAKAEASNRTHKLRPRSIGSVKIATSLQKKNSGEWYFTKKPKMAIFKDKTKRISKKSAGATTKPKKRPDSSSLSSSSSVGSKKFKLLISESDLDDYDTFFVGKEEMSSKII